LVTYAVEPGTVPSPDYDSLAVNYGWAHYRVFIDLLAREEKIDLRTMRHYGGNEPWMLVKTPLRPLLDTEHLEKGRLSPDSCRRMRPRLCEVFISWSQGAWAGGVESDMKADQLASLRQLLVVLDACIESERHLVVR
jgi:hypothetical protein